MSIKVRNGGKTVFLSVRRSEWRNKGRNFDTCDVTKIKCDNLSRLRELRKIRTCGEIELRKNFGRRHWRQQSQNLSLSQSTNPRIRCCVTLRLWTTIFRPWSTPRIWRPPPRSPWPPRSSPRSRKWTPRRSKYRGRGHLYITVPCFLFCVNYYPFLESAIILDCFVICKHLIGLYSWFLCN